MNLHQDIPQIERCENFILIQFPEHTVVQASALESLVHDVMDLSNAQAALLLDMRMIDGFSVEAFELLSELVNNCHEHVAILTAPNEISFRYAQLLEISDNQDHTRAFLDVGAAEKWLRPTSH